MTPSLSNGDRRIALIGMGAIAKTVLKAVRDEYGAAVDIAVLVRRAETLVPDDCVSISSIEDVLAWAPDIAVECAGHLAVTTWVPRLLWGGVDTLVASVGALCDPTVRNELEESARQGRARLMTTTGAIGGLDVLRASRSAGLHRVTYTGRKPPMAWLDTPAESVADLHRLTEPTLIFEGTAAQSAQLYPKNANVTAAVALAGIGFDATTVRLYADPTIARNVHELDVTGAFGDFSLKLANNPLPENPKSSWLASLSVAAELIDYLGARTPSV